LHKLASADITDVFTPLTVHYLNSAFKDEVGVGGSSEGASKLAASANVERVAPSRNTETHHSLWRLRS